MVAAARVTRAATAVALGLTVGPAFKKMGMRDSPTSEIFFDDVALGQEHLLGGREMGRAGRGDGRGGTSHEGD